MVQSDKPTKSDKKVVYKFDKNVLRLQKVFFSGINSNAGLVLAEEYPKGTSSTTLPAFNRLSTLHSNSHHRSAPYTVPSSSNYSDWQYSEPTGTLQYNILSPGGARNRPLSASASLSASKLMWFCQG